MHPRSAYGLLPLLLLVLTGCVGLKQYNPTPETYLRRVSDPATGASADLCLLEFDDEGAFWDPDQLRDTVELIRRRNAEYDDGVLVAVFIHGWKSNGEWNERNTYLRRVAQGLEKAAAERLHRSDGFPRHVVGVYIAWRGDVTRGPVLRELSFWNRLFAADRVASLNLKESLHLITQAAKQRENSRVIMYGHSMGGRILFNTLSASLITQSMAGSGPGSLAAVDLVVLVNPAVRAVQVERFVDLLQRYQVRVVEDAPEGGTRVVDVPLIASITSEADWATRVAFPAGQSVVRPFRAYRGDMAPGKPSQGFLASHTDGHTPYLVSHTARVVEGRVQLEPVPEAANQTPCWVIRTTREICQGHADISNPYLDDLIEMLLERRSALRPELNPRLEGQSAD